MKVRAKDDDENMEIAKEAMKKNWRNSFEKREIKSLLRLEIYGGGRRRRKNDGILRRQILLELLKSY